MRNKLAYYILTFATLVFIGCGVDINKTVKTVEITKTTLKVDSMQGETVQLRETFNQEDCQLTNTCQKDLNLYVPTSSELTQLQTGQPLKP